MSHVAVFVIFLHGQLRSTHQLPLHGVFIKGDNPWHRINLFDTVPESSPKENQLQVSDDSTYNHNTKIARCESRVIFIPTFMETQLLLEKIADSPYFAPNIADPDYVITSTHLGSLIASGYYDMLWAEHSEHKVRFSNRVHGKQFLKNDRIMFHVSYAGASLITRYWEDINLMLLDEDEKKFLYPEDVDLIYPSLEGVPGRKHHFISCVFNGNFYHAMKHLDYFSHEMYYSKAKLDESFTGIVNQVITELNQIRPDHLQIPLARNWRKHLGFEVNDDPVKTRIKMIHDNMMSKEHKRWMQTVTHYMNR